MNDVHYIIIFGCFFLFLALLAPLVNEEFSQSYDEHDVSMIEGDEGAGITTAWQIFFNLLLLPFYTFGFPGWVNLWILLPIRIPFWFIIGRNLWVGGGG